MNRKPFKKTINDIPVEQAHGGSGKRQLLLSVLDQISEQLEAATKGFLEPGAAFDWHHHVDIDEFFFVLAGNGVITYKDGTEFIYQEGDLIYSPANLDHRLENTGQTVNEFIFIRVRT